MFKFPNFPRIIYEDENFLAIDKPAGLMVHHAKIGAGKERKETEPTLTDWLLGKYPEIKNVGDDTVLRPGIVHRLDKETSGVILLPKNQEYFEYLKSLFKTGDIKKTYIALVFGTPKNNEGIINAPIGIKNGTLKRSVHSRKMAKSAVTEYKVLKTISLPDKDGKEALFSFVEVFPKTGRTHQIRVHLASIGHSIVGDALYGPKKQPEWATRMMLHAKLLEFAPKPGHSLKIEAETPRDFEIKK